MAFTADLVFKLDIAKNCLKHSICTSSLNVNLLCLCHPWRPKGKQLLNMHTSKKNASCWMAEMLLVLCLSSSWTSGLGAKFLQWKRRRFPKLLSCLDWNAPRMMCLRLWVCMEKMLEVSTVTFGIGSVETYCPHPSWRSTFRSKTAKLLTCQLTGNVAWTCHLCGSKRCSLMPTDAFFCLRNIRDVYWDRLDFAVWPAIQSARLWIGKIALFHLFCMEMVPNSWRRTA